MDHNCAPFGITELSSWIIESKGMTTQRRLLVKKEFAFLLQWRMLLCYVYVTIHSVFVISLRSFTNRRLHVYRPILISVLRHAMAIQPYSLFIPSLYIPAEYPAQFLFITLTTIPSILRNVVLSNFQFIPDNIRVVSLWYSEEVCNSPTVSNVSFPAQVRFTV